MKIAFDCVTYQCSDDEWIGECQRIDAAMRNAGLPSLYADKWEDWEAGCMFEGTTGEAARAREILLQFPLAVWEFNQDDQPQRIN